MGQTALQRLPDRLPGVQIDITTELQFTYRLSRQGRWVSGQWKPDARLTLQAPGGPHMTAWVEIDRGTEAPDRFVTYKAGPAADYYESIATTPPAEYWVVGESLARLRALSHALFDDIPLGQRDRRWAPCGPLSVWRFWLLDEFLAASWERSRVMNPPPEVTGPYPSEPPWLEFWHGFSATS